MSEITYVPARQGGWTMMTHGSIVLAIDLASDSPRIGDLWAVLSSATGHTAVLDEVIRTGLSSAPAFALIDAPRPDALTVLVRGAMNLRVVDGAGSREITGQGISSWSEQVIEGVVAYELWPTSVDSDAPALPLRDGVAWAAAVRSGVMTDALPVGIEVSRASEVPSPVANEPPAAAVISPVALTPVHLPVRDLEETLASQTLTTVPPPPPASLTPPADAGGYDHLFGETVMRSVEDAAIRSDPEGEPHGSADDPGGSGDHDGHTVMVSDMAALRAKRRAARASDVRPQPASPAFYLELSTGGREVLDQPLIIGRAPSASRVSGGQVPRLVSMNTPNQDISRTHASISAEGGTVVVTDLHSSNGTMITLPGRASQKLRPGEPETVIVGTVIDLGDGATLTLGESS